MITADTITDEQVRGMRDAMRAPADGLLWCCAVLLNRCSAAAKKGRARCAEILNQRTTSPATAGEE